MRKTWAEIRANLDGLRWLTKDKLAAYTGEVGQAWAQRKHRSLYDSVISMMRHVVVGYVLFFIVYVIGYWLFKK